MNMVGIEYQHKDDAAAGMERFTALMSDGGRARKLDLLLHLLANLPRPILLLGPGGSGKTSLFRQVQSRALENWTTCYLACSTSLSLDWICLQMLEILRPGPRTGPEATPDAQVEAELARLAKQNGKLILLLDDAGQLLPGLLGAICQFVRLHPEVQLAFALRPDDLAHKATSDPLALADAHMIEIAPWRNDPPRPASPVIPAAPQKPSNLTRSFLAAFKPKRMLSPKLVGPVVMTLLGAATVAGFVVQALWRAEPPIENRAEPVPETTPLPAVPTPIPTIAASPSPSPSPAPSATAEPLASAALSLPQASAAPQPDSVPTPTPALPATAETTAAQPAETPAPSPAPIPTGNIEEKPFAAIFPSLPANRAPAFNHLLDLWGIAPLKPVGDECNYAKTKALRCQSLRADWQTLQTYNRPAVLELAQGGAKRYLALTGIEGDKAVIDVNGQSVRTPMSEVQPYLRGEAVILWKPPFDKASIGARERHAAARWIRELLGVPAAPGQELVFDEQVKAKVLAFQRQKGLLADGRAGALTLLQIQLLGDDTQSPRLTVPAASPAAGTP